MSSCGDATQSFPKNLARARPLSNQCAAFMSVSFAHLFIWAGICGRGALAYLFAADSSPASALERAVYHCREEADGELLSGRIQIVKYVLHDNPICRDLSLCSFADACYF
jgi:hypothetical protein